MIPREVGQGFLDALLNPPEAPRLPTEGEFRGLQKLAALDGQFTGGQITEDQLAEMALTDPEVVAALDYQQAQEESAELRRLLHEEQTRSRFYADQLASLTGSIQQQQGQLEQMNATMQEQQMQIQEEMQRRQAAQAQAISATDQTLGAQLTSQMQRQQISDAADQLSLQLKQLAATPMAPEQVQGIAQSAPPEAAPPVAAEQGTVDPQMQQPALSTTQQQMDEANNAAMHADLQAQQADAAMQQEQQKLGSSGWYDAGLAKFIQDNASNPKYTKKNDQLFGSLAGAAVGATLAGGVELGTRLVHHLRFGDAPTTKEQKLQEKLTDFRGKATTLTGIDAMMADAKIKQYEADIAKERVAQQRPGVSALKAGLSGALAGTPIGAFGSTLLPNARMTKAYDAMNKK